MNIKDKNEFLARMVVKLELKEDLTTEEHAILRDIACGII